MTTPAGYARPNNKKLAKIFDDAIRDGLDVRYADDTKVVVYRQNRWGCGGIILLVILGIVTVLIVPIILLILGALSPGGQVITYTLTRTGRVKKKSRAAR
jgi:hypothetical protein